MSLNSYYLSHKHAALWYCWISALVVHESFVSIIIFAYRQAKNCDEILNSVVLQGSPMTFQLLFPCQSSLSGAAPNFIEYRWWSTRWTARERPVSTRRPSGETPPGTGCRLLPDRLCPEARPLRAPTDCSASRSSSSTRQLFHVAPPLIGNYQMAPGRRSPLASLYASRQNGTN